MPYDGDIDAVELKRQVENKFAPEPLLAVQGLANTYSFEDDEELLADPAAAREWLVNSGLAAASVEVGTVEHRRLIELRRVVRDLLGANLSGDPDSGVVAAFDHLVAEHPIPLEADDRGALSVRLDPVSSVDDFVAQLLGIVYTAQQHGQWERLKVCASDECRWAFYDSSRNRGGTWCQMEVCGNRIKNRRYRQRDAAGGG